jgi:integrase
MAKRRASGEGTIFKTKKNGKPVWIARLQIGTVNGNARHASAICATQAEAQRRLAELKRRHAHGMPIQPTRQTVATFLEQWLSTVVAQRCRPATAQMYRTLTGYVVRHIGHIQLTALTPQHIQQMFAALQHAHRAPRTIAHTRELLINALGTAERWRLVADNVAKRTEPVRYDPYRPQVLSVADAQRLLDAAASHRVHALFILALSLGLRRGEVLGLRWRDVDLDAGQLQVRVSLQEIKGRLALVEPKTAQSRRTIPLAPQHVTTLHAHKTRQLEERLLAGSRWQDHNLVFPSRRGTPMAPTTLYHIFHGVLRDAGLPPMRFHDLRHACASFLIALRVNTKTVQEILGHSDVGITLRIYTHISDTQKRDATEALAGLIDPPEEARHVG